MDLFNSFHCIAPLGNTGWELISISLGICRFYTTNCTLPTKMRLRKLRGLGGIFSQFLFSFFSILLRFPVPTKGKKLTSALPCNGLQDLTDLPSSSFINCDSIIFHQVPSNPLAISSLLVITIVWCQWLLQAKTFRLGRSTFNRYVLWAFIMRVICLVLNHTDKVQQFIQMCPKCHSEWSSFYPSHIEYKLRVQMR